MKAKNNVIELFKVDSMGGKKGIVFLVAVVLFFSTINGNNIIIAAKYSEGIKVWNINQNRGLINQEHSTVDSMGRVHVMLSHMPDREADDSNFTNSRTKSVYFHYWRDTDGTWKRNEMGYSVVANFRGKLAVSSSNTLYAILPNLRIACATASSNWTDWTLIDTSAQGRLFSDPLIDTNRLYLEDKLTFLCPVEKSPNIYALTYNLK